MLGVSRVASTTFRHSVCLATSTVPARSFAAAAPVESVSAADLEREASIFFLKSQAFANYGPQVNFPGVSGNYAKQLFTKANAAGQLDQVFNDLTKGLEKVVAANKFQHIVSFVPPEELEPEFKKAVHFDELNIHTQELINDLFKNKQVKCLVSILPKFKAMYEEEYGVTNLNLTVTSVPPKESILETLQKLESINLFNSDQPLKLTITVDPEIQGGLLANTDTRRVDWSDKTKYENFRKRLEEAGKQSLAAYRAEVLAEFPKSWTELPFENEAS